MLVMVELLLIFGIELLYLGFVPGTGSDPPLTLMLYSAETGCAIWMHQAGT